MLRLLFLREPMYNELFKKLQLLHEHREELKEHRGFTDDMIDRLGFKSAMPENAKAVRDLMANHDLGQMKEAGILDSGGEPTWQLTKPNILIPFYDKHGEDIIYFRAHKKGLKDVDIPLYIPRGSKGDHCIICESEFKAAAATAWGFHAIGLQGISTFTKDEKLEVIKEYFKDAEFKHAWILWDNEEKTVEGSRYYKPAAGSRYDVEFYAYILSYELAKVCPDIRIACLPDAWRKNDGIDLDDALAWGHTREEIQDVLDAAIPPTTFRNSLKGECKEIVEKKIRRRFFWSPVDVEFGKYVKFKQLKNGDEIRTELSNFTLELTANLRDLDEQVTRRLFIVSDSGKKYGPYDAGDVFSGVQAFKNWISSKGNFWFTGNGADLDQVYRRLCELYDDKITHNPAICGRCPDGYIFANVYIDCDGDMYEAEKPGDIIWKGDTGYLAAPYDEDRKSAEVSINTDKYDWRLAFDRVAANWKTPLIKICLGWIVGSMFRDLIIENAGAFPILFIGGEKSGGKTSLCRMLTSFTGTRNFEINMNSSTKVGIMRSMAYMSNLPVYIDEYRKDRSAFDMNSIFRSAYNNQGAVKGTTESKTQIVRNQIRSSLIMSGEASPDDSGLLSRCIHVTLSGQTLNGNWYKWIESEYKKFSYAYLDIVRQRPKIERKMLDLIEEQRLNYINAWDLEDRYAFDLACCTGPIECVYPDFIERDDEFIETIRVHIQSEQAAAREEQVLNQFLRELSMLHRKDKLFYKDCIDLGSSRGNKGTVIRINLAEAFDSFTEYRRRVGSPLQSDLMTRRTIQNYMQHSGWNRTTRSHDGKVEQVWAKPIKEIEDEYIKENMNNGLLGQD